MAQMNKYIDGVDAFSVSDHPAVLVRVVVTGQRVAMNSAADVYE